MARAATAKAAPGGTMSGALPKKDGKKLDAARGGVEYRNCRPCSASRDAGDAKHVESTMKIMKGMKREFSNGLMLTSLRSK